jgi:ABC-2 type transport system ATP-binding protein
MKHLLQQLSTETLVLDLKQAISTLPQDSPYQLSQSDPYSLEIQYDKSHSLNDVFSFLSQHQIEVLSLRNKTNRLEELFLNLITKNKQS